MTNEECEQLKGVIKALSIAYYPRVASFMELEDLEQEAWIAAMQSIAKDKKDGSASLTTFVFPAIHWALSNVSKREKRKCREVSFDAPLNDGEGEGSDEPNTLHDLIGNPADQDEVVGITEVREELMKRYPQRTVDILCLRIEGLSYDEIASVMKSTSAAVRQTFSRVLREVEGEAA